MATLFKTDGTSQEVFPTDGKKFTLEEMYALVKTDIVEFVSLRNRRVLIVCENGKILQKPFKPEGY